MTTQNTRKGVFAFARQTAVGAPAAAPTYALSINSGGGYQTMRDRADLALTRPTNMRAGQFVQRAFGAGDETILAHETALGLLLYEVCFAESISTITGVGQANGGETVTRHRFTLGDNLPADPLTVWALVGDEWEEFDDTFVTQLVLNGGTGDQIYAGITIVSFSPRGPVAAPTYTLLDDVPRSKYIGSKVFLEANAAPPTDMADLVESWQLTINRALQTRYGASITPKRAIADRQVDFSATVTYDSGVQGWDFYHSSQQGAAAGGPPTQDVVPGSFAVRCGRHPKDVNGNRFLQFYNGRPINWYPAVATPAAITDDNWEYVTQRPAPNPASGFLEYQAAGMVRDPKSAGTTELAVELFNDVATAYNAV